MNLGELEWRSEAAVARRGLGERHALYLQQLQDAAWRWRPQPEPACLRAKARAVAGDVIGVAQAVDFLPEQALQPRLVLDQRQLRGALTVQEQQVEGEEDELVGAASGMAACRRLKIGTASALSAQSSPSMCADFAFGA
jgi:hypothetical protein